MVKKQPTISLFIPTFDRAFYLDQALQSISHQTLRPYETYVLDNASTDNTPEVVKKYAKYGVRYIRNKKNIGPIRNWIKGFSLAKGEYVSMLASDDMIAPNWCKAWTKVLKKHRHAFYTSPVVIIDQNNKPIRYYHPPFKKSMLIRQPHVLPEFWKRYSTGTQTSGLNIYHTKTFRNGPSYKIDEGFATDMTASAEIFLTHDIYYHSRHLCVIRVHEEQTFDTKRGKKTIDYDIKIDRDCFQILYEIYKNRFSRSRTMWYFVQIPVLQYLAAANFAVIKGNFERTIKTYSMIIDLFPDILRNFDDWTVYIKAHFYLLNTALASYNMPTKVKMDLRWLTKIKSPNL